MKTKSILFSISMCLLLFSACGDGTETKDEKTNDCVTVSGHTKGSWTLGTFSFVGLDSAGAEGERISIQTDLVRVTCKDDQGIEVGIGTIIVEDTTYVSVDYGNLLKVATANAKGFDYEFPGNGTVVFTNEAGPVVEMKVATCNPFYLKKIGIAGKEQIEIWSQKTCSHNP